MDAAGRDGARNVDRTVRGAVMSNLGNRSEDAVVFSLRPFNPAWVRAVPLLLGVGASPTGSNNAASVPVTR